MHDKQNFCYTLSLCKYQRRKFCFLGAADIIKVQIFQLRRSKTRWLKSGNSQTDQFSYIFSMAATEEEHALSHLILIKKSVGSVKVILQLDRENNGQAGETSPEHKFSEHK